MPPLPPDNHDDVDDLLEGAEEFLEGDNGLSGAAMDRFSGRPVASGGARSTLPNFLRRAGRRASISCAANTVPRR